MRNKVVGAVAVVSSVAAVALGTLAVTTNSNEDYAAQAEAAFKKTTISYPDWKRRVDQGRYTDVTVTEWYKGFDALSKVSDATTTTAPPTTTAPTPPTTALKWQPPVLTNPITINVPAVGPYQPQLASNQDYILKMPSVPMTCNSTNGSPCLQIRGGNDIVIKGGEIWEPNTVPPGTSGDAIGLEVTSGLTGILHIEGLWIHGKWGQAVQFGLQSSSAYPEVQIQNSILDADHPTQYPGGSIPSSAEVHTDALQSYGGPYKLRLYNVTLKARGTGLQIQPHNLQKNSPVSTWEFHNVNSVQTDGSKGNYALWKNFDLPAAWPIIQSNVWYNVAPGGHGMWANRDPWPATTGWDPIAGSGWNIQGEAWHKELRPEGDFVKSADIGLNYK